jgi:hypothetical protein
MDKQTQPPMKHGQPPTGQQPSKGGTQTGQQTKSGQNPQQGGQTAPSHDDKSRSGNR